jgi:2,4-dienoyl-CoA reductase-like NADH-dependent reductase (Old Yellow Enzyme family)
MSVLFSPLTLRGTTFRNRAWVSPMCQYSSTEGRPSDWHLVHLGSLARGGAGLVVQEATAVTPEGRISPWDAGIWNDAQAADYERIAAFVRGQGAVAGIQLAHAGRKGSARRPWDDRGWVPESDGGYPTVGPSAVAFGNAPVPEELDDAGIDAVVSAFGAATRRSLAVGFDLVEIHAAHGYLLHEFLSPLSNLRTDRYGGDLTGRSRLLLEVVRAVRAIWPEDRPVLVRLSATDWVPGGWDVEQTVEVARRLVAEGVDLVDVSSGGLSPDQQIDLGPGYQVPFARAVRERAGLPVAAVGLITGVAQAEAVLADGSADAVVMAREMLRNPHWPLLAAAELGADLDLWPPQYRRAIPG